MREKTKDGTAAISLRDKSFLESGTLWKHEDVEDGDSFLLKPGTLVLAKTHEFVCIPGHLVGMVEGRSSYARAGIAVHITAPKIDPGFEGTITLEFMNHGPKPVMLEPFVEMPCQLMLLTLSTPLEAHELYGTRAADTFQGQDRPTGPRRRPPAGRK